MSQGQTGKAVNLDGMKIVVTGALGALGSAFCDAAAASGARVVRTDFRPGGIAPSVEEPELAQGGEAYHECDVTDERRIFALLGRLDEELEGIDVVANFAGRHHRVFDLPADDPMDMASIFRDVIELNLTGAFLVTAAAARIMVARRTGHIIHLCSNGSRASLYGSYAYNASKHGVEGIVKTAAAQLAPFGVRVNGVAPGTVLSDLNRSLSIDEKGEYRPRAKSILAHTPTKRFATAAGVAQSIVALCVPQVHLTGNVVFCDDGYNIEGHSWPEGTQELYAGAGGLERLYAELDRKYPRR